MARIIAATPREQVGARLSLVWGVTPVITEDTTMAAVRARLLDGGLVTRGSVVVFVSMHPELATDHSNFVHVETV
jgi:pyruvate kinase